MHQGEETRRRVIAKAAAVFNTQGYSGTALSDLMEATGLQKGGIYRHFESKEQLALEAFDYAFEAAKGFLFHELDGLSPLAQLRRFIANFVRGRSPLPGGCPMVNTAIDCDDGNPALREHARLAVRGFIDRLAEMAESAIAAGEIKPETDARALALFLFSSLEGALVVARLDNSHRPLRTVAEMLEQHLNACAAEPTSQKSR